MIVTNKFIFLHLPKTGGSFVRHALRYALTSNSLDLFIHRVAYAQGLYKRFRFKLPFYTYKYEEIANQHSFWKSVPHRIRDRKVLSIIRNPVKWTISHYTYGFWKKSPVYQYQFATVQSFEEFFDKWDHFGTYANHPENQSKVGNLSAEFICFFTDIKDRKKVYDEYPRIDLMVERMRDLMPSVYFLHTENLNNELSEFLHKFNFEQSICDKVNQYPRVNTSRKAPPLVPQHILDRILEREAFLFHFFPEYK